MALVIGLPGPTAARRPPGASARLGWPPPATPGTGVPTPPPPFSPGLLWFRPVCPRVPVSRRFSFARRWPTVHEPKKQDECAKVIQTSGHSYRLLERPRKTRRGGRAAYCTGLENQRRRKPSESSNLSPSAPFFDSAVVLRIAGLLLRAYGLPSRISPGRFTFRSRTVTCRLLTEQLRQPRTRDRLMGFSKIPLKTKGGPHGKSS